MENHALNTKSSKPYSILTLIWVGFLGVRFAVGGGKITPFLKSLELR